MPGLDDHSPVCSLYVENCALARLLASIFSFKKMLFLAPPCCCSYAKHDESREMVNFAMIELSQKVRGGEKSSTRHHVDFLKVALREVPTSPYTYIHTYILTLSIVFNAYPSR